MLDGFRNWLAIGRMQRRKSKTVKAYSIDIAAAKKAGKTTEEVADLRRTEYLEITLIDDEIGIQESRRLTKQAAHYRIPVPQDEDDWEDSAPFGTRFCHGLARQSSVRICVLSRRPDGIIGKAGLHWLPVSSV
jgi:hypothetical protein